MVLQSQQMQAGSSPIRRHNGVWREPHHNHNSYPYDYDMMSPHPSYGSGGYPGPTTATRGGPPPDWAPPTYGNEHPSGPGFGGPNSPRPPYWGGPPTQSNPYDGYRGGPPGLSLHLPPHGSSMHHRGPPHHYPRTGMVMHHPSHLRSPQRRGGPYAGGEQQVGLEPRTLPPSPGEHQLYQYTHQQRKDFCPPAPAGPVKGGGQSSLAAPTREVHVTVSASADSDETAASPSRPATTKLESNEGAENENENGSSSNSKSNLNNDNDINVEDMAEDDSTKKQENKKEKGDMLSVLASVSAGMDGDKNRNNDEGTAATEGKEKDDITSDVHVNSNNISKNVNNSYESAATSDNSNAGLPLPAPTSPLQRRMKPSPITPSQTPGQGSNNATVINGRAATTASKQHTTPPGGGRQHQPITPSRSHESSSTAEGEGGGASASQQSLQPLPSSAGWEPPSLPRGGNTAGSGRRIGSEHLYNNPAHNHPEYATNSPTQNRSSIGGRPFATPSRSRSGRMHHGSLNDFGPPFPSSDSPALVERGSFDSHGDSSSSYRGNQLYPPPTTPTSARGGGSFFYDDHPSSLPPGPSSGAGYWESGPAPPYSPPYPPPNRGAGGGGSSWNQPPPHPSSSSHSDPYYGVPYNNGPPPPQDYPYSPHLSYGGSPDDHDPPNMYGGNPPPMLPPPHGGPPPPYHYRGGPPPVLGGPPPPPHHHMSPPHPMHPHHMSGLGSPPYPYGGHPPPRMEEKTILRKKFSWKHYPELERFLIANRDEYLKHSNMNYTAEQKQYNNWLTERLLEVAGQHNYMFDPDDFNFVAIRDRIRCYYKSYVQTARKRGLKLPEKKGAHRSKQSAARAVSSSTTTTEQHKKE